MSKTCGECVFFSNSENKCCLLEGPGIRYANNAACKKFKPEPPKTKLTNGDVIRQGGNKALLEYRHAACNAICTEYKNYRCSVKNCHNGLEAWLNAPAESKESEVEDE